MSKSWNVVMCSLASLWMACSGGLEEPTQPDTAGEMRLSVSGLTAQQLDSLVITVQPANVSQALSYSATTDTFVGTLVLPVGAQSLTAHGHGTRTAPLESTYGTAARGTDTCACSPRPAA